jgi:hypothetical protein
MLELLMYNEYPAKRDKAAIDDTPKNCESRYLWVIYLNIVVSSIAALSRFAGYSLYISNSSITKIDG